MVVITVLALLFLVQTAPAQNSAAQNDSSQQSEKTKTTKNPKAASDAARKTKSASDDWDSTQVTTTPAGRVRFEFPTQVVATNRPANSIKLFPPRTVTKPSSNNDTETAQTQPPGAPAANDASELAKKLANPVASLISFPIQTNFDFGMGSGSGWRMTMNIQPVIPVALNEDWNLISRTILPIIHQGNVVAQGTSQSGLGDIVQSLFISPNKAEPFVWGIGPAILVPSATNGSLGSKQLGLGPTVVVLKQQGHWTVGALWNHVWRVAGGSDRPNVNADFVQPFLVYSTKDGWSYTLNTESTYDWTGNHWSVPIHGQISKVVRFGRQPVSFGGAIRCWATSPAGGPEGCGLRIVVTGIFPKK
jgi:hypothetical protein